MEISDPSLFNIFAYDPEMGSVTMGIFLGLVLGKPIGITLFSFLSVKLKIGAMPEKTNWAMFFAVACLGGIGFTMSIFVDTLSFGDQSAEVMTYLRNAGKIAILLGSIAAGVLGTVMIQMTSKLKSKK